MFVANWKMNGSSIAVKEWLNIISSSDNLNKSIFCPPLLYLKEANEFISEKKLSLSLGAQDIDPEKKIGLTGGISPSMLKDVGCKYSIIGHSERRNFYKEDSTLLIDKVSICLKEGIKVIFCIGESLEDRNSGDTKEILSQQLRSLDGFSSENLMVAYEPVWAIGSGRIPLLEDISETSDYLIDELIALGHKQEEITILYGGSVDASNAKEIYQLKSVSGLLIGGASLDGEQFLKIIG